MKALTQCLYSYNKGSFERGAPAIKEFLWLCLRGAVFERSSMPWYALRRGILNWFGGSVGTGTVIKPSTMITFPWRLEIGNDTWIGEGAWLLNLAQISIGNNVCISQRAFVCTGTHNWSTDNFDLVTKPIVIKDGAWICAGVIVAPGVTIGENTVITAGSIVSDDMPPNMVCSGNPCVPVKPRGCQSEGDGSSIDTRKIIGISQDRSKRQNEDTEVKMTKTL